MRKWWPALVLILFLAAILTILFTPYLHNYFVADSFWHLSFGRFSLAPEEVWWRPCYGRVFWRPLAWSADAGIYDLVGLEPFGNHLADAVLHGLNALLVAGLAWILGRPLERERFWRYAGAYLAGLLFALHPIGVLTASWLCCRSALFGTFFVLLSLIFFLQFRGRVWAIALSGLFALAAMLSKETMIAQPALILAAAWLFPAEGLRGLRRLARAVRETLPFAAVPAVYLGWRLSVLGQIGGYEPVRFQLSFFLPRLAYHLPRILMRVPRDLLFHHLEPASPNFRMLAAFFLLLLLVTGWRLLQRERPLLTFCLVWLVIALAPLWNVSQMLAQREERLLYFALVGWLLLAPAGLAALSRPTWRALALCLWILVFYAYSLADLPALKQWQQVGRANQALAVAIRQKVTEIKPAPAGGRFYLLGLSGDQYYLDPMVKLGLPLEYLGNRFMLGDHPSLVWEFLPALPEPAGSAPGPEAAALPHEEVYDTESHNRLLGVTPPDLVLAVQKDPQARVWEWKGDLVLDISQDIRALSYRISSMQNNYSVRRLLLPTWSFFREPLPWSWTLSPDCRADKSDRSDEALALVSLGQDPYLLSPEVRFHAPGAAAVLIELKVAPRDYLPPDQAEAVLMWSTEEDSGFRAPREIRFPIQADGEFHTYRLDLESNIAWVRSDLVRQVRLDPVSFPTRFWLRRVVFLSKDEAKPVAKKEAGEEEK